jgi:ABC-type branched-subunit amino acid transport system substrate-binding protein
MEFGSRRAWLAGTLAFACAGPVFGQSTWSCSCGADPPGPPKNRELRPYANSPADLRPYANFAPPYHEYYGSLIEYNGAARERPTLSASDVDEVRIGFLGPLVDNPNERQGRMMLDGAQLAIDEANGGGGYGGKPFRLMVHNDQAIWGASSNEVVRMVYSEKVWAILGSIGGDSTHIGLRVALRSEVPLVNSAATDPTIPETAIPWYLTTIQDDRVQSYTLTRRIYSDLHLRRIALLRVDDRYGKFGVAKFKDAARRLGHPIVNEQRYSVTDKDFHQQLQLIDQANAEGIVIWGDAPQAALILKQMREVGMKQRIFGSYRVLGDDLFQVAGEASEGLEVVFPYDAGQTDPAWVAFCQRFEKRFGGKPDAFASLAFDTINLLLHAICQAGLNRGKIRDALTGTERYKGVTGEMIFDPNCKNITTMYLATIHDGKAQFRRYGMAAR